VIGFVNGMLLWRIGIFGGRVAGGFGGGGGVFSQN
jgi:hypothetical protein